MIYRTDKIMLFFNYRDMTFRVRLMTATGAIDSMQNNGFAKLFTILFPITYQLNVFQLFDTHVRMLKSMRGCKLL